MSITVRAMQGDTVDLICLRHYGRTAGVTERVLFENTGLADLGAILPMGTEVKLPKEPDEVRASAPVQLWD